MSWLITPEWASAEGVVGVPWGQIPANLKWTPASITTALWLDAADSGTITGTSNVTSWLDKSGNTRNATASIGPSLIAGGLNNKSFLRFDANNEIFSINYGWPSTQTVYLVTASNVATISSNTLSAIYGSTGGQTFPENTNISTHNGYSSTAQRRVSFEIGNAASVSFRRINGNSLSSLNVARFEFVVAGFAASGLNQQTGNVSIPVNYFPQISSDLAEIIVLNSIATISVAEKIEGYLAHKWGLTGSLPNNHPYKVNIPVP